MEYNDFTTKELDYILKGLYNIQQSYGGGYVLYEHNKNVQLIIEKIKKNQEEELMADLEDLDKMVEQSILKDRSE